MLSQIPELDIEAARFSIWVHDVEGGPDVPGNSLAQEIASKKGDDVTDQRGNLIPSPNAARARMRTCKLVALRRHFDRQHLTEKAS